MDVEGKRRVMREGCLDGTWWEGFWREDVVVVVVLVVVVSIELRDCFLGSG